jgi:serine/threonine protein kinase
MQHARPTTSRRRLLGLSLAAAVIATPWLVDLASTQSRQRRVAEEAARAAREGGDLAREALDVQLQAVAMMTDNAVANPRFLAALRGRVDHTTLADLLSTESWWEPYRNQLAAISYDGATVAFSQAEGADGLPIGEMLRRVGKEGKPSAVPLAGARGSFLAAARPVPLGRDFSAVLLLAKRIDDAVLSTVAGRSGRAILVSDGKRALGHAGPASAELETLVGQEARGDVALSDPAEHAAAVAVGPGLWLWSRGRTDVAQAAAAFDRTRRQVSWIVAIPLALAIAAVTLRRRRRPAAAAAEVAQPAASPNFTRLGLSVSGDEAPASSGAPGAASPPAISGGPPGPGTPLGRYMLVDRIGEGGMAEIYTAISFGYGGFRRAFVVKRLRPELIANATAVDLFIDEANLASTLVHPNVVPVFDFGEAAGSYFLAQEYVIGRDLGRITRRLHERGEPLLSVGAILQMAHEVLAGLEYAHAKRDDAGNPLGIVHRDITPDNVMISERGEVKVLDFGIMKATHRVSQTESGTVKGSVGFMSPEQARGKHVDHRSDLFSLGLVILYAATGEPTYPGEAFYDLLTAAAAGPGDAERARIAALPKPLPAILERALQFDPDRRFQSSTEFRAAIAPHAVGAGATELADQLLRLFGDELRAERDRLAAAIAQVPRSTSRQMPVVPIAGDGRRDGGQ